MTEKLENDNVISDADIRIKPIFSVNYRCHRDETPPDTFEPTCGRWMNGFVGAHTTTAVLYLQQIDSIPQKDNQNALP